MAKMLPREGNPVSPRRLFAVRASLACHDRAIGHDWDNFRWEDGPDVRRGRGTAYVTYRRGTCTRCTSLRTEVFEQGARLIKKVANRYKLSEEYKAAGKMTQAEVHTALRAQDARQRRQARATAKGSA